MRRILIADNPGSSYGMPWKGDAPCFNFKMPNEHFHVDEIENIGDKSEIGTLVIGCNLPDYDFISDMVNLQQLYIYSGKNLIDLSFIEGLVCLRQLYLAESHITSLEPFASLTAEKSRLYREGPNDIEHMLKYAFEAVCLCSDRLDCDPNELTDKYVLRTREFVINNKRAGREKFPRRPE